MGDCSRRDSLRIFGASVLFLGGLSATVPLKASAGPGRSAPTGDYRLSRTVRRELFDGGYLAVERSWSCRFAGLGRGMSVDGEQIECLVSGPGTLGALAEMERRRRDTGPFPAVLDESGLIVSSDSEQAVSADQVIDGALADMAGRIATTSDIADQRRALGALTARAQQSLTAVPRDLFFPRAAVPALAREFEVAPGLLGQLHIETDVRADESTGLLLSRERRIRTGIAGEERISSEIWDLQRL